MYWDNGESCPRVELTVLGIVRVEVMSDDQYDAAKIPEKAFRGDGILIKCCQQPKDQGG